MKMLYNLTYWTKILILGLIQSIAVLKNTYRSGRKKAACNICMATEAMHDVSQGLWIYTFLEVDAL